VVGKVGAFVAEGGSTDGDGLGGSGWGVVASVGVIVTCSNGEVDTVVNSSVNSKVQGSGLATTERHVGD